MTITQIALVVGGKKVVSSNREEVEVEDNTIFNSVDIIITTVDQVVSNISRFNHSLLFECFLNRFVVFDEYHELLDIPTLFYVSLLLMHIKDMQNNKLLLISATPRRYFISRAIASGLYEVSIPSFNTKPFRVEYVNQLSVPKDNTLHIYNTAIQAQEAAKNLFYDRQDIFCYHSRFREKDKARLAEVALDTFGRKNANSSNLALSGPIAQASLNISRLNMGTEMSKPDYFVQRTGRVNRFSEYEQSVIEVEISKGFEKGEIVNTCAQINNKFYFKKISYKFFHQLQDLLSTQSNLITVDQLSQFYHEFHEREHELVMQESMIFAKDAINELVSKSLFSPQRSFTGAKQSASLSLRGESAQGLIQEKIVKDDTVEYSWPANENELISAPAQVDYEYEDWLNQFSAHEACDSWPMLKKLPSNIKYRAKNAGKNVKDLLKILAKNKATPLVLTSMDGAKGLVNFVLIRNGEQLNLGYMKAEGS